MQRLTFTECAFQYKNGRLLLQDRCNPAQNYFISKRNGFFKKNKDKKDDDDDDDEKMDKPFKFSTSKAATFPAAYKIAESQGAPWYQGIVISACLSIFMIYFGFLREENDIDLLMDQNLPPDILQQWNGRFKDAK